MAHKPWYAVRVSEFAHPRRGKPPIYEYWYAIVFEDDFESFKQDYAGAWITVSKEFATKLEALDWIGEMQIEDRY